MQLPGLIRAASRWEEWRIYETDAYFGADNWSRDPIIRWQSESAGWMELYGHRHGYSMVYRVGGYQYYQPVLEHHSALCRKPDEFVDVVNVLAAYSSDPLV